MDILKIKSDLMNNLLSKLITRAIRKQTGYDITLSFNGIEANMMESSVSFHADLSGKMSKDDFVRLLSGKAE